MSLLIINTTAENDLETQNAISKLTEKADKYKIINTSELNISHCIGCNTCMIESPGVCCLNDDYKGIAEEFFLYDSIIFICNTSLNFLDSETIKIFERRFPFVIVYSEFRDGKIRHPSRYEKIFRIGILYKQHINSLMINQWLDLYVNHFSDESIGAFHISEVEEVCKCI